MTLSRKILLRNAALVIGLLLLAVASLVGLDWLRYDVRIAADEYMDLRAIEKISLVASQARGMLATGSAEDSPEAIADVLEPATTELQNFIHAQDTPGEDEPAEYDAREKRQGEAALQHISGALTALRAHPPDLVVADVEIRTGLNELNRLAQFMDRTITSTQGAANRELRRTTLVIGILSIVIAVAAVVLSILQHRSVIIPLRGIRAAVGTMSRGKFDRRVEPTGDAEYRELAVDFNHMAAELESFYRELEQKVAVKSKQLALSERLASVGFLAAGVAHEINNPLSIISGYAELSIKRLHRDRSATPASPSAASPHPEIARTLEVIRDEAFRCKEITGKMLALARGGSDRRETLSLAHVAADVAELVGGLNRYADRRVTVRFKDQDHSFNVVGNPTELKQVLLNLTVNGLEAVPPTTGEVVIEGARDNGTVRLTVKDNGKGMPPEVLEHVFEPFFTEKRGAGEPGTGLGLSISHAIIDAHGGTIRAESAGPGKGSRFTLTLPAASSPEENHG